VTNCNKANGYRPDPDIQAADFIRRLPDDPYYELKAEVVRLTRLGQQPKTLERGDKTNANLINSILGVTIVVYNIIGCVYAYIYVCI
jgi:hypothetical protein